MALCSALGFNLSHAIDESELNELVGKKVQEALAKEKTKAEKTKAKNPRADKSVLFAGLGYSGMFSWNLAYKDSFVLQPHFLSGRLLERKDPSTILNGFNFKVGYQYIAPVKIEKMGFGVRGGFQYSYKAGNCMEKDEYQPYFYHYPIGNHVYSFNGSAMVVSTYSFFMDFLHNVYENEKFFIGYFIGAGLGGESVTANVLKDFGNILAQLAQFQGYGSLGLRMGDKHHTLELSASIHGDAPSCSLKKPKSCESARFCKQKSLEVFLKAMLLGARIMFIVFEAF